MTLGYENPVNNYRIGDVVRFANGKVEWTIVGKGATTGLRLTNENGRERSAQTFDVSLVRRAGEAIVTDLAEKILKVVDHLDRLAEAAIQDGYSLSVVGERGENYFSTCVPEGTRRRCAADREIVALHSGKLDAPTECRTCYDGAYLITDGSSDFIEWTGESLPCPTLIILARGYGIQP